MTPLQDSTYMHILLHVGTAKRRVQCITDKGEE